MSWKAYEVIFRVRTPLHIGWSKVGNVQRTRPYVTGRSLWGALTMRLTRDRSQGPATDSKEYEQVGQKVHDNLAFTYFYPALKDGNNYRVEWPWEDEAAFRRRLLSSYQSTALTYPSQSSAEGTLHEVEFISPRTLDTGAQVFLKGYVFEKQGCSLQWQSACKWLQIGGERGYGWGNIEKIHIKQCTNGQLFGGKVIFESNGNNKPILRLDNDNAHLLAHTNTTHLPATGNIEPLVGREWRSYPGESVVFTDLYFTPGSSVQQKLRVSVEKFGIWVVQEASDGVE
ncbi:MAG: RAMP superfamily CRISPR-associated protein [Chloroflexus sp.]|uniref:RAMP superfamily CRISPR-associated protein n=1 Tax=Chloroflexus sp. TaxID=1904827 RepID=UPI004049C740